MPQQKRNLNKEILGLFSGQSSQVTTPKVYIEITGSHSLATILNQAVFWSNKSSCSDGFFYKTYAEWFEEIHIPERTLRRHFDTLEKMGLITTKVKKVDGKNTKHVQPHVDKIIELISDMLDVNTPIRPTWPDGAKSEQKPCTKTVPTGQNGRSEPANLADSSIYTEEYLQKNTITAKDSPAEKQESSSSFFTSKQKEELKSLRHHSDTRGGEIFIENCQHHIETQINDNSKYQRIGGLKKILKGLQETGEVFKAKGYIDKNDKILNKEQESKKQKEFEAAQDAQHFKKMEELRHAKEKLKKNKPEPRRNSPTLLADMLRGMQ